MYEGIYVCIYIYMCVCEYIYCEPCLGLSETFLWLYCVCSVCVWEYVYIYIDIYVDIYIYAYTRHFYGKLFMRCEYIQSYIHTNHTYIHTHTNTHVDKAEADLAPIYISLSFSLSLSLSLSLARALSIYCRASTHSENRKQSKSTRQI